MTVRTATAAWEGTLKEGKGVMRLQSGAYEGPYTWASRFADGPGTNPEELLGAAHAGCYSMFLSALLTGNGTPPVRVETTAKVHLGEGPTITNIDLICNVQVPDISEEKFQELAQAAKEKCPVSKVLAAAEISLQASLV
ncbi:MAG: OsmC family protein [Chloroflexi bacterium]|nr:OsmC family protein [Chloroflexota bacterium]MBP6470559.1 OsmC family protein [Chloroflexota bacterium]MBP7043099.1 OsmC family protein [Chloroflexota bacterium]MBP7591450.1 OsmC family protein [Chloroflexota bacterium]